MSCRPRERFGAMSRRELNGLYAMALLRGSSWMHGYMATLAPIPLEFRELPVWIRLVPLQVQLSFFMLDLKAWLASNLRTELFRAFYCCQQLRVLVWRDLVEAMALAKYCYFLKS
ncbi:replicase polyprotein 1ab [Striga asiatica]|uniref:Replicase polyprotein 1ab n=1 Tax=Striga asiatica TaxID=4170 RepID=A0A5A7PFU2_STRAF|nr:replicase polyprotein 1ab [Striga asiatica]